jgi:hypothetical protein
MSDVNIKQIFTLCALSNLSSLQYKQKSALHKNFRDYLDRQLANKKLQNLIGNWRRIWGPYIYSVDNQGRMVADNSLFAALNKDKDALVISIAGTNPISLYGWEDLDLLVHETAVWPFCQETQRDDLRVSLGSLRGLMHLVDAHYQGQTLKEFLKEILKKEKTLSRIIITGHSLGGALALCAGLWLEETRAEWLTVSKSKRTRLEVYAFAAPTSGNRAWCRYTAAKLKSSRFRYQRIWHKYDLVPYVWDKQAIKDSPSLYTPEIPATDLLKKIAAWAAAKPGGADYSHVPHSGECSKLKKKQGAKSPADTDPGLGPMINSLQKSVKDLVLYKKHPASDLLNTYRFFIRAIREHSYSYFVLLEMKDVWEIMVKDQVFSGFFRELHRALVGKMQTRLDNFINTSERLTKKIRDKVFPFFNKQGREISRVLRDIDFDFYRHLKEDQKQRNK